MSDDIPASYPPSARYTDRCAACGCTVRVLTLTWKRMRSFWGKFFAANLCRSDGCQTKARVMPDAIVREVDRRRARAKLLDQVQG